MENKSLGNSKSEVIFNILRNYARNQIAKKKSKEALPSYLDTLKEILPKIINESPEIEVFLVYYNSEIYFPTKNWGDTKDLDDIVKKWGKIKGRCKGIPQDFSQFEFQEKLYKIRDISGKHLISFNPEADGNLFLGLKRVFDDRTVYIFAQTKPGNKMLQLAMNTLKRATIGNEIYFSSISVERSVENDSEIDGNAEKDQIFKDLRRKHQLSGKQSLYEAILDQIDRGLSRKEMKYALFCSYVNINRAIEWNEKGRPPLIK
jgi:hypothetical protein